jgi:PHP family Zn ribbon phosphoesterase
VFELTTIDYPSLKAAIMRPSEIAPSSVSGRIPRNDNKLLYTIEFYPEEGKYHFSGHRNCNVSYGPEEIREKGTICPVCKRKMTEGVLLRVQQLADETISHRLKVATDKSGVQWFTDSNNEQPPFVKLVPLLEIVAEGMGMTVNSQKVKTMFETIITKCGSELDILLTLPLKEIEKVGGERIAEGVRKVRAGEIVIKPGFDGEYGKVAIWKAEEHGKSGLPQLRMDF